MELNDQKSKIQDEALNVWVKSGKKGTAEIITGLGKTFLALKALYTMPKHDQDTIHLFLAEQKDRLSDLMKDILKFNEINNCNVMEDYNLQFQCYQTVRNWSGYKLGLVIADEIHDSISTENYKFYLNNKFDAILGLTALFNGEINYTIKREHNIRTIFNKDIVTKQELLDHVAPIVFKYNVNQGQKEGTSRKLNIYIVENRLNITDKNVKAGNSSNTFYQTEAAAYAYVNKKFEEASNMVQGLLEDFYKFQERKNISLFKATNKRCKLLYELPSKLNATRHLLANIVGKTVIFGNSIDSLKSITPNVVSSKQSDAENNKLRELFDNGFIHVIGSFKKLVQGANLDKVDNCIIMSYYSTEVKFIQMIGRLRQNKGKEGNVFILVTKDTQEEVWLSKMIENSSEYNIIRCNSVYSCIEKYKQNNITTK
jgi:superfamily II DNA or RNA helicase